MRPAQLPPQDVLNKLLTYDPETGKLFWLRRDLTNPYVGSWNTKYAGKEAFCTANGDGYLTGALFDVKQATHRVIWKMVHGEEPEMIDHINRNKGDNRLSNLRAATAQMNSRNRIYNRRADSGIYTRPDVIGWVVIRFGGGKTRYGGVHKTLEAARAARDAIDAKFGRLTQEEAAESLRLISPN